MTDSSYKTDRWHYLHFGWWPREAPKEPDDLRDCARNVVGHYDVNCPFCKKPLSALTED